MTASVPVPAPGQDVTVRLDPPADGPANMEQDAAMLADAVRGAPPALRLYGWDRPTLTVGHRQEIPGTIPVASLLQRGIPWVRRPTGGRALLHLPDELTYAVAAPRGTGTGVRHAYVRVMRAIWSALSGFVRLDPPPAASSRCDREPMSLPCLAVATGHEITAGRRKVVSGAQRWSRGAFLQHGSIPWVIRRELVNELAGLPPDHPLPAAGIAELAPTPPARPAVAAALMRAFRLEFGSPASPHDLPPAHAPPSLSEGRGRGALC